jgi:hypothetical protein
MRNIVLASAAVIFSLMACKQESGTEPAASAAPAATAPPAAAAASAGPVQPAAAQVPPAGAAVPVPEDFEDEAKKTVTADTLNSQLDKLEKTIASAPAK